ncbi:hypothetical protein MKY95_21090 [Paenibacillus sp. FSL P4-0176]|uniref:hypothetical protein n=1 Tax=Paenibacillus sp. FSL P4-0176 TaxID=2921631 RepID=UPI0030D02B80
MDKQQEKQFFDTLRRKLKEDIGFLGLPVKRSPLKTPGSSFTEDDFVELFEPNLKQLKASGEMVVAEMNDGNEYYIVPTAKDDETLMEEMMEQHPQFVRISEEVVVNVTKIEKFDKANRLVTFTNSEGEVTHKVENEFWDKFIAEYYKHNN